MSLELSPTLLTKKRALSGKAPATQRISEVDALRGIALLGITLIHCLEYFELYWQHPEQSHVRHAVDFLFADKAYAVFALLFGLSFFIIMDRQARRGIDFSGRFVWRLMLLIVLGYVYSLIYVSDILQVLGVLGLSLLLFNRLGNGPLLALSFLFLLQPHLLFYALGAFLDRWGGNAPLMQWSLYAKAFDVFAYGSFWDVVRFNSWQGQLFKWAYIIESQRISSYAALFIWGLLLGRTGFFAAPRRFLRPRRWGIALSLAAAAFLHAAKSYYDAAPLLQELENTRMYLGMVLEAWISISMMIFGVLLFLEIYSVRPFGRLLDLLAPCGRMSLTVYVAQGVLCVPLFYGYGLGWYDGIGQEGALLVGLFTYAALTLFAHGWMRYFRYGPLEYLWRCGTYLSFHVPLRRHNYQFA